MIGSHIVVDAHCHIGLSLVSGVEISEEKLLATMDANGVDLAMVMPQPHQGMEVAAIHDRIARFARQHPRRIRGMASISPRVDETEYRREATRCVEELDFGALKLDPSVHALPPNHPRAEIFFATARDLGVPAIVHTGMGVPWALPALLIPPAQKYPDATIVMAHAGFAVFAAEALIVAQLCPNVVLEPSWCASFQVADMVRTIGADRVMYGSDHPSNVASELAKLQSIDLTNAELRAVLGGTASRLFQLGGTHG